VTIRSPWRPAVAGAGRYATWTMCAQCMATAAAAVGGASGLRAWLGARGFTWLTPIRLKRFTFALMGGALLATATLSGAGS
jgi:hypothetical protein